MTPDFTRFNIANQRLINFEHFSYFGLTHSFLQKNPYFFDFFIVQLGLGQIFASCLSVSIKHIGCIFSCRSKPQMIRIYTRWVITFVKNINFRIKDYSLFNENKSSSHNRLSIEGKNAISVSLCENPVPAFVLSDDFDFFPKSLTDRFSPLLLIVEFMIWVQCLIFNHRKQYTHL